MYKTHKRIRKYVHVANFVKIGLVLAGFRLITNRHRHIKNNTLWDSKFVVFLIITLSAYYIYVRRYCQLPNNWCRNRNLVVEFL